MQPFEIVCAPYTLFVAPVGTAPPAIDDEETDFDADWFKLGTSGPQNYDDAGVTVNVNETTDSFTGAASTLAIKAWRTAEEITVGANLADLSIEQFAKILDDAAIVTTAKAHDVAGHKRISLVRGVQVKEFAVLARGLSPYDEALNAQYEFTRAYQSENQAPQYNKAVAMLAAQFSVLDTINGDDPALYDAQTTVAGT
jgi:hypothetical protein